jgi:hypothetical protein
VTDARALLLDLHQQGFRLAPAGDGICVMPASRLTPELAETIRANKPALLAELREQAAHLLKETESRVADLQADPAWRRAWEARLAYLQSTTVIQSVINTTAAGLAVARRDCEAGDLDGTRSACAFVLDYATGKTWDGLDDGRG